MLKEDLGTDSQKKQAAGWASSNSVTVESLDIYDIIFSNIYHNILPGEILILMFEV